MKVKFLKRIYNEGQVFEPGKVYKLDEERVKVFAKEDYLVIEKEKKNIKEAKNTAIKEDETKQK